MNKKVKYLIFVVVIIVLAGLAYLIAKNNQTKTAPDNTSKTLTLTPEQQAAVQRPSSTPVYTEEINVEFMTDAEKLKMQIPAASKIQVLGRNTDGKVTAYKVITQDSDIMTKYGN